tara:strand:+ start:2510 stop:3070 length:561 start_codon:yes stop_codon:yes gene_type:complete
MFRRLRRFIRRLVSRKKQQPVKPRLRFVVDARSKEVLATLDKRVQPTFTQLVQIAKAMGQKYGVEVKAISGHRSYSKQAELYAKGRTKPGSIVTHAKPGYSKHNFGTALDFGCFDKKTGEYLDAKDGKLVAKIYRAIYNEAERQDLRITWGGLWRSFKDTPHFEYITGLTMAEMRQRKEAGLPVFA